MRTRIAATFDALTRIVSSLAALALFLLTCVVLLLSVVGVGLLVLERVIGVDDRWGVYWRARVGRVLGREVPGPPQAASGSLWQRVVTWSTDAVRWRNLAHLGYAGTAGLLLAAVPVATVGTVVYATMLFIAYTQDGYDTGARWFSALIAAAAGAAWWLLTPPSSRLNSSGDAAVLGGTRASQLRQRVEEVTRTRTESLDLAASEIRRIERDLHDGPQARLVSLGMNLGLARELLDSDPDAVHALLLEASHSTGRALEELRGVVRDIRPPVLADRGLVGAVEALALDLAVPVTVTSHIDSPLPEPLEAAVYFAVNEILANVVKHSGATHAFADLAQSGTQLAVTIVDNGHGGALVGSGSGLVGVARRIAAFDGTMSIDSPVGGPTRVRVEVPCESS